MKFSTAQLLQDFETTAKEHGVDPNVAKALFLSENSGRDRGGNIVTREAIDSETTSPKGAYGFGQVMPETFAGLQRTGYLPSNANPKDPKTQVLASIMTIKELNDRGIKTPAEIAVAYNGGNKALADFRAGRAMNAETTDYLVKFSKHSGSSTGPTMATTSTQRTSEQTTQRVYPPGVREEMAKAAAKAEGQSAEFQGQLRNLLVEIGAISTASEAAAGKQAEAGARQAAATGDIALAGNDNANRVLTEFGINLNDPRNNIQKNAQIIERNSSEREALMQQIRTVRQEGAGGIMDPIGWIMSAVKEQPLVKRYNAIVAEENMAGSNIDDAQRRATNQRNLQPAAVSGALATKRAADIEMAIAAGEAEKLKIRGAARAAVASTLVQLHHTGQQDLANKLRLGDMFAEQRTVTNMQSEKEDPAVERDNKALEKTNILLAGFGMEPYEKGAFSYLDKDTKAKLITAGQNMSFGNAGEAAATLYTAFKGPALQKMKEKNSIGFKMLQDLVINGQAETEVMRAKVMDPKAKDKVKDPFAFAKTPEDILAIGINGFVKRKEEELKGGDMSKLGVDNPYKFQIGIGAAQESLAGNTFAKMVREDKNTQWDDNMLLQRATAKVITGKEPIAKVAAELRQFYREGYRYQEKMSMMLALGFSTADTYPMMQRVSTVSPQRVDMFNQESIEQFITRQATTNMMDRIKEGFGAVANQLGGMAAGTPMGRADADIRKLD